MKKTAIILTAMLYAMLAWGQCPQPGDAISIYPQQTNKIAQPGPIPSIKLCTPQGSQVDIGAINGPAALVGISNSLPYAKTEILQAMADAQAEAVDLYFVYTTEAAPDTNCAIFCPYSGPCFSTHPVCQAFTYEDRRQQADSVRAKFNAKVLVDNPNNDFWDRFGQLPNAAFLICNNEIVRSWSDYGVGDLAGASNACKTLGVDEIRPTQIGYAFDPVTGYREKMTFKNWLLNSKLLFYSMGGEKYKK